MNKKLKLATAVVALLMVTAIVVTFEACKKEADKMTQQVQKVSGMNDVDRKINDFGERMKQAAISKSDETMPVNEAMNNLTNYQNFKMCDARAFSTNMAELIVETTIPCDNGSVMLSDINMVYESSRERLLEKFHSTSDAGNSIYCIISTVENESKSDSVTVVTRGFMPGSGEAAPQATFGPTDYWYDFDRLGKCDIYAGQCIGWDATTEMSLKMQMIISVYGYDGGRVYLYDFHNEYFFPDEIEDPNSASGYALHIRPESDPAWCLSPDELNHYRLNIIDIIHGWSQEQSLYNRYLTGISVEQSDWSDDTIGWILIGTFAQHTVTNPGFDD